MHDFSPCLYLAMYVYGYIRVCSLITCLIWSDYTDGVFVLFFLFSFFLEIALWLFIVIVHCLQVLVHIIWMSNPLMRLWNVHMQHLVHGVFACIQVRYTDCLTDSIYVLNLDFLFWPCFVIHSCGWLIVFYSIIMCIYSLVM